MPRPTMRMFQAWLLFTAACAGGDAQKIKEREKEAEVLRAEVEAWKNRAQQARQRTQDRLNAASQPGSRMVLWGGNAQQLEVTWSSVHTGQKLQVRTQTGGPAQDTPITLNITKGRP